MDNQIELLYSRFLLAEGVSTDTRTIGRGDLFFALSGPNFNGNVFAQDALDKGASFVVVDDKKYADGDNVLLVPDALEALQKLAVFHRKRFRGKVLAITGSNGKTTTKELVSRVLRMKYDVLSTEGNLNNHIGVPLTLLKINPQVEIAVIEMGASSVGDIAELCSYALPTHGIITNIGHAHTETFGGIEGVLKGKTELFDFLIENDGYSFLNISDSRLNKMDKRFNGFSEFPSQKLALQPSDNYVQFHYEDTPVTTGLIGDYNFPNLAAAVAIGEYFEVPKNDIIEAISSYKPDNWRSQIIEKEKGIAIVLDAYNANPDSMKVAIESFIKRKGKKAVILGDMLELEDPASSHAELGSFLSQQEIELVLLVGEQMMHTKNQLPMSRHFDDVRSLKNYVSEVDWQNFQILLKGSRRMKLEELVQVIS